MYDKLLKSRQLFRITLYNTIHREGEDSCYKCDRCACTSFYSEWRGYYYPSWKHSHSDLAHYTWNEMLCIFSLCSNYRTDCRSHHQWKLLSTASDTPHMDNNLVCHLQCLKLNFSLQYIDFPSSIFITVVEKLIEYFGFIVVYSVFFLSKLTNRLWSPFRPVMEHRTPISLVHLATYFFHSAKVKNEWSYTSTPSETSRRGTW